MITNVNAETYTNSYWSNYTNANRNFTFSNVVSGTQQNKVIDFNTSNMDTTNYNSIKGFVYVSNLTDSKFWSNSIDIVLDCTQVNTIQNGSNTYTITYPDRTQSSVTGIEYEHYCDTYEQSNSNNIFSYQYNFDNRPQIQMQLVDTNNNYFQCEFDNNYNFTCPGGRIYKQVVLYINKSGITSNYQVLLSNVLKLVVSDSQQIINNQNQNTTSINNNITNLNDNILNSSINSQTTNDVNNISTNNLDSSSKNVILDFMLLPINFLQNLLNSFDSTCATLCLGDCSTGHDNDFYFVFPCIDLQSILGSSVYNVIDVLMTFGMVFAFIRSVVKFLKKALLLESDVSSEVQIF